MLGQKTEDFGLSGSDQCLAGRSSEFIVRIVESGIAKGIDFVFGVLLHSIKGFMEATSPNVKINITDGQGNSIKKFSEPYNPIELN